MSIDLSPLLARAVFVEEVENASEAIERDGPCAGRAAGDGERRRPTGWIHVGDEALVPGVAGGPRVGGHGLDLAVTVRGIQRYGTSRPGDVDIDLGLRRIVGLTAI